MVNKVSRGVNLDLMKLLDHLGGPCGSLTMPVFSKVGEDVCDRDSMLGTGVIF